MIEHAELLCRWSSGDTVALAEFGGADAVLQAADDMLGADPLSTVEIIVENWASFGERHDLVQAILVTGATTDNLDFVDDIHDVLLSDGAVLDVIANELVVKLRQSAERVGILGDVATETWTRLALGGWCSSLPVRAHLQARAERAASDGSTTIYLVRSVGAAMSQWGDAELVKVMAAICSIDEFEADAAYELGLFKLGTACAAETVEAALAGIRDAVEYLRQAEQWDGRMDARAYLLPLDGLLRFAEGAQISDEDVATARHYVNEYLLGYRGLKPHWRQGRADISLGWSRLLGLLNQASQSATTHWFDPSAVIEAAASLYVAETSITLVSRPSTDSPQSQGGVSVLIRPRLVEAFSRHAPSAEFIDLWLDRRRESDPTSEDLIVAVEHLRSAIQPHRQSSPKASDGSVKAEGPAGSIDAALQDFFEHHSAIKKPASLSESDLVRRILLDIKAITPRAVAATVADLTALVLALVQFTAFHLNQKQSGTRKISWLGEVPDVNGHYPREHVLSDALTFWLSANGLRAQIELVNIGGGEADVAVRFTDESFYIEVKRVLSREDDEAATDHYGDQASQYAATDVPIVFLALLDYARRSVRVDLEGAVWTREHRPNHQSRSYSLTGFRIQGNAAPPSASSRRRGK